jgi:hypothetical protein
VVRADKLYPGEMEFHRDAASRRRRRKEKSQIWDSKIWSQVPRDSDPSKTMLMRTSSTYKRHTCPLIREGAPQKQGHNCQRVINIWPWAPDGARHQDLLIDWPSVAVWLWIWQLIQLSVDIWVVHKRLWRSWEAVASPHFNSRCRGTADEDTRGWKNA